MEKIWRYADILAAFSFLFIVLGNYVAIGEYEQSDPSLPILVFLTMATAKIIVVLPMLLIAYTGLILDSSRPIRWVHYAILFIPVLGWAYIFGFDMQPLWGEWKGFRAAAGWIGILLLDLAPLLIVLIRFEEKKNK